MLKNFIIKLPTEIKIIYDNLSNYLILLGPTGQIRFIRLKFKLIIINDCIFVTKISILQKSIKNYLKLNTVRGNEASLIKKLIVDLVYMKIIKLVMFGVGYRFILNKDYKKNILELKLGFSHNIVVNIPSYLVLNCSKPTVLFLIGDEVIEIANKIKTLRFPEPYKGKGIFFEYEKIKIKEGKKS